MILRRLSQSLKEQNRTAITVEFLLLVLGVFLGIQAANWNSQRAEDTKAEAYLARIRGNLQSDLLSIRRREVFWGEALREELSQYYLESGAAVAYLFYLQPEYRKIVRGLTPSVAADHIWAKCWMQPNPTEQHLIDCDSPISEAQAQAILDGYVKDPKLLPELRFWVASQGVALNVLSNYRASLNAMLAREKENTP